MRLKLASILVAIALAAPSTAAPQKTKQRDVHTQAATSAVLWTDPGDISKRDLFNGPGGRQHQPAFPVKFVEEDQKGTSPKFDVSDREGQKWRAKLGEEAKPETVATRLIWAVGYTANEAFYFPVLQVENLPRLKRGREFEQGTNIEGVRLQRNAHGGKKKDNWNWRHNPFYGTREFNGLRVMMALLSNWDLKDENNAIIAVPETGREFYEVSDVGASFGRMGKSYTDSMSKANVGAYRRSKFVSKVTASYVDFNFPRRPPLLYIFNLPLFVEKMRLRWVGKHIPLEDARWIASLLAQLSDQQLRDAFRAAGYTPDQIAAYTTALEARIAELKKL